MSSLKNFTTLKKSKEFAYIYNNAKKSHTNSFILFYKKSDENRVGFTASKKVGNAVKRNFAKRRLRAAFLEYIGEIKSGTYVFVAKKEIIDLPYTEFLKSFRYAMRKLNAIQNSDK